MAESTHGRAPLVYKGRSTNWARYTRRVLGFRKDSIEDAFNAGVVLFNMPAFVTDDFARTERPGAVHSIRLLPDGSVHSEHPFARAGPASSSALEYAGTELGTGRGWATDCCSSISKPRPTPAIIHYVSPRKPWCRHHVPFENRFWAVVRDTDWFHPLQEWKLTATFRDWLRETPSVPHVDAPEAPLFSVIMPVYNREARVGQAIRSVLLQEFSNFELIVIDDASTDRTVETVQCLAKTDARIRVIEQDGQ